MAVRRSVSNATSSVFDVITDTAGMVTDVIKSGRVYAKRLHDHAELAAKKAATQARLENSNFLSNLQSDLASDEADRIKDLDAKKKNAKWATAYEESHARLQTIIYELESDWNE